jgi:hypothetical protein
MLKKVLTVIGAMALLSATQAQDSTKGTTALTYSVDGYYKYDFAGQASNNKTSFTNSANSFELGMASIRADHSFGKVAATIDLGFGRRAAEFSYNDTASGFGTSLAAIKQAYVSYQATSKLKFTMGKWATHIGFELLDAYSNRNYSMSYGFSNGPFFHTGLRADYTLGAKSAFMIGVANVTDHSTVSNEVHQVAIAQYSTGTKDDKIKGWLNFQAGKDLFQTDLVLNFVLSSKWGLNYDGTIQNVVDSSSSKVSSWSSNALYLNYDPSSKIGWTLREEYFSDKSGDKINMPAGYSINGNSVLSTTLSANIHLSNLTIIPELRFDSSDKDGFFSDKDSKSTKSATSFILAATYKF